MSDRLFCGYCLGTEQTHALWEPCPIDDASATEAGTAETVKQGSVHECAVPEGQTPNTSSTPNPSEGEG